MKKVTSQTLAGLSICFDLDGTVVDTAPDSRRMITDALGDVGDQASDTEIDAMQTEFLDRYASSIDLLSLPFPGVVQTLGDLLALGADLSICTNKPGWLARPLLRKLDLDHYFTRIIGGDEPPQRKPAPGHIFQAAGHRDAKRIIMVGDSWPDMRAAHNANVHAILMTYGYSPIPQIRLRAGTRLSRFRDIVPTLCNRYG